MFLLLSHVAATLYMTGLIWFVQLVHYPLFGSVGSEGYSAYQQAHMSRTSWAVGPAMLVEAGTTILLLAWRPAALPAWMPALGAALLFIIWASTALLQVPRHGELLQSFDPTAHLALVRSNWVRTLAWSARGLLVLAMLANLLRTTSTSGAGA